MTSRTVLSFHAEKLHDDRVWRRVLRVSTWMARHGMKATFFVYPFRAQVVGKDITDRLRHLVGLGHEIGQHTHFYAGDKIDPPDKANDFSAANVANCLRRDCETFRQTGLTPKGFTAGAWIVTEAALDTLIDLGFTYDCSARLPKPGWATDSPYYQWLRSVQSYNGGNGSLLQIPTTCSLGEWFKHWGKCRTEGPTPYQLIYLHDYDLLTIKTYFLMWTFLTIARTTGIVGAGTLARQLTAMGNN